MIPHNFILNNREWKRFQPHKENHTLLLIYYVPLGGIFMVFWHILTSLLSDSGNLPDLFQRTQSSSVHTHLSCPYIANFFNDCSHPHCFSSSPCLHPAISEKNIKAKMLNDSARITSLVKSRAGLERRICG